MEKKAMSPLEIALSATLAGVGGFGGLRILQNALNGVKPKPSEQELALNQLDIPREKDPEEETQKVAMDDVTAKAITGILAGAGGLGAGYYGSKKIYEKFKHEQKDQELQSAYQEYVQALQAAKEKVASVNTPSVDSFCTGLADSLNKQANWFSPPQLLEDAGATTPAKTVLKSVGSVVNDLFGKPADHTLAALAALALLTGGAGYLASGKKEDKKELSTQSKPYSVNYV